MAVAGGSAFGYCGVCGAKIANACFNAGKGGVNTGMFEELSINFLVYLYAPPAIVILMGVFSRIVVSLYKNLRTT